VILDSKLLVAPVIEEDADEITLSLPSEAIWYRFRDGKIFKDGDTMNVNMSTVPVFVRYGSIIPEFVEIGGSAYETLVKPIRLYVFLDSNESAEGDLYLDDGTTYNFEKNSEYMHRIFKAEGGKLKSLVGCPDDWKKSWGVCDPNLPTARQSPIDIIIKDVPRTDAGVLPLQFQGVECDTQVRNIGATLSATPKDPRVCNASFTTLSGTKYKFYEAHVHWHKYYNHRGTEHRVDGQAEAVEVQLIHFNAKFPSIDEAFRDANVGNIAVVAIRYTVAPTAENATEAPDFDKFITIGYEKLKYMDLSLDGLVDVGKLNPYNLIGNALPRTNLPMFQYNGSLTVPSCDSITSWYIVQQTVMLSQSQVQQLRFIQHVDQNTYEQHTLGFELDDNIRPLAPLNGREVVAWPDIIAPNVSSDSAPSQSASSGPLLTTGAIIGISVAAGVLIIGVTVLITSLVCVKTGRKGYEGINASS